MRRIDISVNRPTKPKKKELPNKKIVWPTMDEDEEGEPTLVSLQFFDGATKKSGSAWIDIPGWYSSGDTVLLWEHEQTFDVGKPFHVAPHNVTYQVHGNEDSRVPPDIIASEFSDANPDRWERKPLATRPKAWRYDGNRWLTGGTYMMVDPETGDDVVKSDYSMFNIRAELVSGPESEPQGRIDPDAFHEGEARRMKLKWEEMDDGIRPLIYFGHFPGRRLGLKCTDQSRSYGQYVNGELSSGFDWINSIYFCPFDTSDSTNFKITTGPSFTDSEVNGTIVWPGKWEVFLMPRRWLYRVRYRHVLKTFDTPHVTTFSSVDCVCDNHLISYWGYIHDEEAVRCDYTQSPTCPSTSDGDSTMTAYYSEVTHYDIFFWGRWPCNWSALWAHGEGEQVEASTANIVFYDATHAQVGDVDLVSSPTYEEARQFLSDAGGESDDIANLYTGGLSGDLHVCSDSSGYFMKVGTSIYGYSPLRAVSNTSYGGPPVSYPSYSNAYIGFEPVPNEPEWGIRRLWQVIEQSPVWTSFIAPLRDQAIAGTDDHSQASRIDMLPWGVAVSPSMAGDLVAVIRNRGRAWFVWRRTDEEITPLISGSVSNPIRWESNTTDGRLGEFFEGDYAGENVYDADYCDLWVGDERRKLTGIGRTIALEAGDVDTYCPTLTRQFAVASGDAEVELHAPAYIMLSDERAFSDITWSSMNSGANVGLRGRVSRINAFGTLTADERNSY